MIESVLKYFFEGPLWMKLLIIVGGVAYILIKTLRFVKEGEQGLKLRFGKVVRDDDGVPRVIMPGFVILIPFAESLKTHQIRQQTIVLTEQNVILKDNSAWSTGAVILFKICDVYKSLFEINDLESGLRNVSMGKLRSVMQSIEGVEGVKDVTSISQSILSEMKSIQDDWGVVILDFYLTDCSPTPATAAFINASTLVTFRHEALKLVGAQNNPMMAAALLGIQAVLPIAPKDISTEALKEKNSFPSED